MNFFPSKALVKKIVKIENSFFAIPKRSNSQNEKENMQKTTTLKGEIKQTKSTITI
jgi:hypothetical protein